MRAALVQCPVWWTVDPPLGLAQVAGCVRHFGHEPRVFDLNIRLWKERSSKYDQLWNWEQSHFWNDPRLVRSFIEDHRERIEGLAEEVLKTDAPVVGFSVCSGSQWFSLEFARLIKQADPARRIVWGGQFFSLGDAASDWIRRPEIDAVVRGAGDFAFPALLGDFERSGSLAARAGVLVKEGDRISDGGLPETVRDLDRVPFADLSGFPIELYTDPTRIPIAASRGCIWKCRFCSMTEFWDGYAYMSGDRIFAEIGRHKKLFPKKGHVEFYDITANGNVASLQRLSELLAGGKARNGWTCGWKINAVIRPEMTRGLLDKMALARCNGVIYGIESGSPKVLKRMNKPYDLEVADRVLRDTHEAGIRVTANVMFGFPGEEEEDFELTLEFLRRNHPWLDRAYGSATFTSLEEHSYLTEHAGEFGIRRTEGPLHHLYWETADGRNTYALRLKRYRRFRETAIALGIDAYKGVDGSLELNELASSADYFVYGGRHLQAIKSFLNYLERDFQSEPIRARLRPYLEAFPYIVEAQRRLSEGCPEKAAAALEPVPPNLRPRLASGPGQEPRLEWGRETLPNHADLRAIWNRLQPFLEKTESGR